MSNGVPLHLHNHDNRIVGVLVGRRQVPLDDADPGVRDALDRAVTNHDGRVDGPLSCGRFLLVGDRLVRD